MSWRCRWWQLEASHPSACIRSDHHQQGHHQPHVYHHHQGCCIDLSASTILLVDIRKKTDMSIFMLLALVRSAATSMDDHSLLACLDVCRSPLMPDHSHLARGK